MIQILLNSIALEPNRWTQEKIAYFPLEQLLAPIVKAGFHFVEVWQYHISRISVNEIGKIQAIANSLDLKFPILGIYPKLHLSGRQHQAEFDKIERLMDYAKRLDVEIIKMFVGGYGSDEITDSDYRHSIDSMQEILELANSFDLIVTAETHPNTLADSLESVQRLMKTIDSENLKLCFQPFDFYNNSSVIDDYRVLAADVIHVHYQGQKNGKMALLKESELDYRKLTTELIEHGFSGKICIEFVKNCVVKRPETFDLEKVLKNAKHDRDFIVNILKSFETVNFLY